jgi:methionine-rich copper-binding protein CopC
MKSRSLSSVALALIALLAWTTVTLGHATLLAADPANGGTLTTTPYTLTLTFDEPLAANGSTIVVRASSGAEVATGGVSEASDTVMTAELPALAPGQYVVRWTALTPDDGAVERGTLSFTVEAAASTPSAPTPGPTPPGQATGGNDLLIALLVAAVAIAGVVGFLLVRGRR